MKTTKLKKQYKNNVSNIYADVYYQQNQKSRELFYKILGRNLKDKKLVDLACGDGLDLIYYHKLGADTFGIDMSKDFVKAARKNNPKFIDQITIDDFESLKFTKNKFDIVVSKYAIQTSSRIDKVFDEAHRILKPKGEFYLLVTHPIRQYVERRGKNKNYFIPKVVNSVLFDGALTVREPAHTFKEYLSSKILKKFDLQVFDERYDSAAEQIDGDIYPGFMIMKFRKR